MRDIEASKENGLLAGEFCGCRTGGGGAPVDAVGVGSTLCVNGDGQRGDTSQIAGSCYQNARNVITEKQEETVA